MLFTRMAPANMFWVAVNGIRIKPFFKSKCIKINTFVAWNESFQ